MLLLLLAIACAHTTPPGDGSARALRHAAIEAESQGDLQRAFDLARDAYVARPTTAGLRHVRELETRLEEMGGVAER